MIKEIHELNCRICGQSINYSHLTLIEKSKLNYEDEEELLDVDEFIETNQMECTFPFLNGIVLNPKAVTLNDHQDSKRLYGCCGPSTMEKLNQVCPNCESEIGLLVADCWTSHFVGIDLSKVSIK